MFLYETRLWDGLLKVLMIKWHLSSVWLQVFFLNLTRAKEKLFTLLTVQYFCLCIFFYHIFFLLSYNFVTWKMKAFSNKCFISIPILGIHGIHFLSNIEKIMKDYYKQIFTFFLDMYCINTNAQYLNQQ